MDLSRQLSFTRGMQTGFDHKKVNQTAQTVLVVRQAHHCGTRILIFFFMISSIAWVVAKSGEAIQKVSPNRNLPRLNSHNLLQPS